MAEGTVSLAQLTAWIGAFEALLLEQGAPGPSLARGMTAVREKLEASPAPDSVADLFTLVGMTLVGAASGASGPLYGTFFLRFGMSAGAVDELDAASLGRALHAGHEGAVERGTAALGATAMLDVLSRGIDVYDGEIAGDLDVAAAASTASRAVRSGHDHADEASTSVRLLLAALATALATTRSSG
jgi:dihydroxyacetone kinase-like protein